MELKSIPLSYGMGVNTLVNDRLKRVEEIKQSVRSDDIDFSILDKVKSCSCDEIPNIIESITSTINNDMDIKKFISFISLINGLINILNARNVCDNLCDKFISLINKINDIYKRLSSETTESLDNEFNNCISNINTFIYRCKNIHEKADVIEMNKINEIQSCSCNESIILSTTSQKIYSESYPNGTNVVGKTVFPKNPDDILSSIINSDSDEQFMNRLDGIKNYFDMYKLNINRCDIAKIMNLIKFSYNKFITNNTGLSKLKEALNNVLVIIDNSKTDNFDSCDSIDEFKQFISEFIEKINNRINENETNDDIEYDTDPITEFGFGFVYEYPIDMTLDETISFNNEFNKFDDEFISDYMRSLREAIGLFDREERKRKKQERREQHSRNVDTMKYKGRILTLTNKTVRNALNGIKRAIQGVTVGAAVAVVVPQIGLAVGALSIISAFCRSKLVPSNDKKRCMLELHSELKIIEDKIAEMDRAGDLKNKAKLMRLQDKMKETYNHLGFTMNSGDLL